MLIHPGYQEAERELLAAKNKMKAIKLEAIEACMNQTDIENAKADIKLSEDVSKIGPRHVFTAGGNSSEDDRHWELQNQRAVNAFNNTIKD